MRADAVDLAAEYCEDLPDSKMGKISIRAPEEMIEKVKRDAEDIGILYSDYVRAALEMVHSDESLRRLHPPERASFHTPACEDAGEPVSAQLAALTDAVSGLSDTVLALSGTLEEHIAAEEEHRNERVPHEAPGGERPLTRQELEEVLAAAVANLAASGRQALGQASERIAGSCRQEMGQMMAGFSSELVGSYQHELDKVMGRYIKSPYSEELHSRLGVLELPEDADTAGLLRFIAESANAYNTLSYRLVDLFEESYRMVGSCIRIQREIRARLDELRSSPDPGAAGLRHGGDVDQGAAPYPAASEFGGGDGYAPDVEIAFHAVGERGERGDARGNEYAYPPSFVDVPEQYRRSSGVLVRRDYAVPDIPERSAGEGCSWSGSVPHKHEASPSPQAWNTGCTTQQATADWGRRGLGGGYYPDDSGEPYPEYEVD